MKRYLNYINFHRRRRTGQFSYIDNKISKFQVQVIYVFCFMGDIPINNKNISYQVFLYYILIGVGILPLDIYVFDIFLENREKSIAQHKLEDTFTASCQFVSLVQFNEKLKVYFSRIYYIERFRSMIDNNALYIYYCCFH